MPTTMSNLIVVLYHNIDLPVPELKPQSPPKPRLFRRKYKKQVRKGDHPPSWMEMVVEALKFIREHYAPGDDIILFGLSGGIEEDFLIVNAMVIELANQLATDEIEISCVAHIHRNKNLGVFESNDRFLRASDMLLQRRRVSLTNNDACNHGLYSVSAEIYSRMVNPKTWEENRWFHLSIHIDTATRFRSRGQARPHLMLLTPNQST
ncbi:unnamed protein product [Rhizoctonia solani]|uniref:Uncharacterized protein n=1 Tax=Rhizoctonia solani TaxID=456999 RepID=A0A8H3HQX7_9AGAM|nr:unnamed protein product [Rhizoctonia solani]